MPDLPCRGGGVNPTSMAQNDIHVALIILTTQMWGGGGGLLVEKTFLGQILCSCAFGANNRSYTKQRARHGTPFFQPPPLLQRASMPPPPPPAEQFSGRPSVLIPSAGSPRNVRLRLRRSAAEGATILLHDGMSRHRACRPCGAGQQLAEDVVLPFCGSHPQACPAHLTVHRSAQAPDGIGPVLLQFSERPVPMALAHAVAQLPLICLHELHKHCLPQHILVSPPMAPLWWRVKPPPPPPNE